MSTIVSAVDLWIPDSVAADPSMADKWEEVLKALAPLINQRRQAKIPDEAAYQSNLAEPAIQAWNGFVNPGFRSKHGRTQQEILNAHDSNIQDSFEDWKTKLDQMFATVDGVVAKRFKDQVSATKGLWSRMTGKKTLRITGDGIRGLGAGAIAGYWLIGEQRAASMLRPQDNGLVGGPFRICQIEMVQFMQPALTQGLIRGAMAILDSKFDSAEIAAVNATINHFVQSLVDPALGMIPFATGADSHLDFVKVGANLKLSIQVSQI